MDEEKAFQRLISEEVERLQERVGRIESVLNMQWLDKYKNLTTENQVLKEKVERLQCKLVEAKGFSRGLDEVLKRPINEFEFSVRVANCLEIYNITTIEQLVVMTPEELLRIRNFGRQSLKEVEKFLVGMGLKLGMDTDLVSEYHLRTSREVKNFEFEEETF